ncbi:MAG: hypothetical protein Q9198_011395, partial [Flavoplaca austrocitrina]
KFLEAGGIELLIKTYQAEPTAVDDRDRLRKKVTHFVLDHLLPTAETGNTDIPNGDDGIEEEPDPDTEWTMIHLQQLAEKYPGHQNDEL